MADADHIAQLKKGIAAWNAWREENPDISPDLRGANLRGADLRGADLNSADLNSADLSRADLRNAHLNFAHLRKAKLKNADLLAVGLMKADLTGANLSGARLRKAVLMAARLPGANLSRADLSIASLFSANLRGADLSRADLSAARLTRANLHGATLREANLSNANVVGTDLTNADITGCHVYGISVWGLKLDKHTKQENLVITPEKESAVYVDDIQVAQFIYLLLNNEKIRDVIDTIGKKGVLLLGRFTEGRMLILNRLREKLRSLGFVPLVFNFDKPETKDFTETVRLLANLSHFVIVDITNPRSTPLELQALVPDYMVPFVPILEKGQDPFAMFVDLQKYDWVLKPVIVYPSVDRLIEVLENKVVRPAEAKFNRLLVRRAKQLRVENV